MTRPARHFRHWTPFEDDRLAILWGTLNLRYLAKQLRRSPAAVRGRVTALKLGPIGQETFSLEDLMRESGYSQSRLLNAAVLAKLKLARIKRAKPGQSRSGQRYAITEAQKTALYAFLKQVPDGMPLYPGEPGKGKSKAGAWGVGRKPDACQRCQRADVPHFCKGYCKPCHGKVFPKKAPADQGQWGVAGRPDACTECSSSKNKHAAKGVCTTCYDRAKRRRKREAMALRAAA